MLKKKIVFRHWTINSTDLEQGNKPSPQIIQFTAYTCHSGSESSSRSEISWQRQLKFEGYHSGLKGHTHRELQRSARGIFQILG